MIIAGLSLVVAIVLFVLAFVVLAMGSLIAYFILMGLTLVACLISFLDMNRSYC